jgi:hypothetical protein
LRLLDGVIHRGENGRNFPLLRKGRQRCFERTDKLTAEIGLPRTLYAPQQIRRECC